MAMVKIKDFTQDMITQICEIINRGNQCEIKREKTNIVIVEIERHALSKNPTD